MYREPFTDRRLRIAFVSDAIYPYNKGGKEKRIYEITTRLAQKGHHVTIYCMKWWKDDSNVIVKNGVHLKAISPLYPLYSGERRSIKQAILFALSCFTLIKEQFDVLDVDHMPHLVLFPLKIVSVFKRKKLFVTWHEVWGRAYWVMYLGILGNLAYIIELISAQLPSIIIAVSAHTKRKLQKDLKVSKEIVVIPNGINYEHIISIKQGKEKSDIIFAGRLLENKHVDRLIEAIGEIKKKYPLIKVFIIGNGPEKKNLLQLVRQLHLEENILFYDFFETYDELYSFFKASKIFVLPSTREGFGIVALEANACGLPVITTNHPDNATRDLIKENKNGYFFKQNNLAETLLIALKRNYNKTEITAYSKPYDWNIIANQVEEAYLS